MLSNDNRPLVSVLMNCYNSSKFIGKAIQSVIDQSYKNWELVIWDDGSTDDTLKTIKKFKDSRIKLFSEINNVGLGKSRTKATKKLNGSLISILDSDDYYHPEKLNKQVDIFQKFPEVAICATWTVIQDQNYKFKKNYAPKIDNNILKKKLIFVNMLAHSAIMYRKNSAQKVGWYSNKLEYAQDYDLTCKLIANNEIYLIKEILTYVPILGTNMTNTKNLMPTIIKENILILKNNMILFNLSRKDINLIKSVVDIYLLKMNIIKIKKNFFKSAGKIIKIIFFNPLIIFKSNLIKSIKKI